MSLERIPLLPVPCPAQWIPVGHAANNLPGRRFSHNNAYGGVPESPSGAAAGAGLPGGAGTLLSGPASHVLVLDNGVASTTTATAAGLSHQHPHGGPLHGLGGKSFGGGLGPPSPGAMSSYAYGNGRTPKGPPKQFQLKVSIEDRDEHEAILELAGRLPYIRAPSIAPSPLAEMSAASSGKPRAVTAPAELRTRRAKAAADAAAAEAAAAGVEAAAEWQGQGLGGPTPSMLSLLGVRGDLVGEPSGLSAGAGSPGGVADLRRRLPSVTHQLHRAQATAAAMAEMSGYQANATAAAAAAASVGAATSCHGTARSQQHPQAHSSGVVGIHGSPPLALPFVGPTHGQLSTLGVIPSCSSVPQSLSGSPGTYSPQASCRRRAGGRARGPGAGGLPNLPLPVDQGPSQEVLEQLAALDAFDGAVKGRGGGAGQGQGRQHGSPTWQQQRQQQQQQRHLALHA